MQRLRMVGAAQTNDANGVQQGYYSRQLVGHQVGGQAGG